MMTTLIIILLAIGIIWYLGYLPTEGITLTEEEDKEEVEEKYGLSVTTRGRGEIEIDPEKEKYEEGTEVTITATPEQDWYLNEWTGDHTGISQQTTITIDSDKEITAHFQEESRNHTLTINIEGEGQTTPAEGTHTYTKGERVTITATPAEERYFNKWTGDHESKIRSTRIRIDENKEITAIFGKAEHNIEEPMEIVERYIKALDKGESEKILNYTTPPHRYELETIIEEIKEISEDVEYTIEESEGEITGKEAKIDIKIKRRGIDPDSGESFEEQWEPTVYLTKEDNIWKINEITE